MAHVQTKELMKISIIGDSIRMNSDIYIAFRGMDLKSVALMLGPLLRGFKVGAEYYVLQIVFAKTGFPTSPLQTHWQGLTDMAA